MDEKTADELMTETRRSLTAKVLKYREQASHPYIRRLEGLVAELAQYSWQTVPITEDVDAPVPCYWCLRDIGNHYHNSECPVALARKLIEETRK